MVAISAPPLGPGQRVHNYLVKRVIGKGGMGIVYEGFQEQIGRRVAIKVLAERLAPDVRHRERFLREARACSSIQHEGLVKIFDFGRLPNGMPYILMEYLDGESLRRRLRRQQGRRLPWPKALQLAQQLAAALATTHAHRIVHRDLKPENVMLIQDPAVAGGERAKLLDFGVAMVLGAAEQRESGARFTPLTTAAKQSLSMGLGTPIYMSPEHFRRDARLDGRSDVYALGVMLFEILTGSPPFQDGAVPLAIQHVFQAPPSPRLSVPELPAAIEILLLELLRKQPRQRPTMAEVAARLAALLAQGGQTPVSADASLRRRTSVLPALAVCLGVAGFGILLRHDGGPSQRVGPASRPVTGAASAAPVGPSLQEMVLLPGGRFRMGSSPKDIARSAEQARAVGCLECIENRIYDREQPQREVELRPFFLDDTEVTNQEYAAWLNSIPSSTARVVGPEPFVRIDEHLVLNLDQRTGLSGIEISEGGFTVRPFMADQPVVQVSWWGARLYCLAHGKDLPTEAQWELAARGLGGRKYPWGDQVPHCLGVAFGRSSSVRHCLLGDRHAVTVASMPQDVTPEGIHDLGGNVAEWVLDSFSERYPECGAPCRDPVVTASAARSGSLRRVIRGGSWYTDPDACRSAGRGLDFENSFRGDTGFRCARVAP